MSECGAFAARLGMGVVTLWWGYLLAKTSGKSNVSGSSRNEVSMTARTTMARNGHQE